MATSIINLAVLLLLFSLTSSGEVPIQFTTSQSPHAFLFKAVIKPQATFRLYSKRFRNSGDYWTNVVAEGDNVRFEPKITANQILFNDKHQGEYHIALYGRNDGTGSIHEKRHFHYAKVQVQGQTYGFLLPLFTQEVPGLRTDRLFRCSNTLLSIEWKDGSATIVAFSKTDKWRILQSIDDGFMNQERGIHYGRAIDHGHTHGFIVELGHNEYCVISQKSQPAPAIELNDKRQFYDVTTILELVGKSQPIRKRSSQQEQHPEEL